MTSHSLLSLTFWRDVSTFFVVSRVNVVSLVPCHYCLCNHRGWLDLWRVSVILILYLISLCKLHVYWLTIQWLNENMPENLFWDFQLYPVSFGRYVAMFGVQVSCLCCCIASMSGVIYRLIASRSGVTYRLKTSRSGVTYRLLFCWINFWLTYPIKAQQRRLVALPPQW